MENELQTMEIVTWDVDLFAGFYCSELDGECELSCNTESDRSEGLITEKEYYDIRDEDWKAYENDVSKRATELILENIQDNEELAKIITGMEYVKLSSPRFYNYTTDKLVINVTYNEAELYKYCFETHPTNFNQYLKDNYTSYSGFISFIANNAIDFYSQLKEDKERCMQVMLEFIMITAITDSCYKDDLFDYVRDCVWEYSKVYSD